MKWTSTNAKKKERRITNRKEGNDKGNLQKQE